MEYKTRLKSRKTCENKTTLNIRMRSDSVVIASNAGSPSSFGNVSSHVAEWSTSFNRKRLRNPPSSFFVRRFSSFSRSFSLASAYGIQNGLRIDTPEKVAKISHTFSSKALNVSLTFPPSRLMDLLSSLTTVAKSSKDVFI